VGYNTFEPHWAAFSLQWGVHNYIDTLLLVAEKGIFGGDADIHIDDKLAEDLLDTVRKFGALGQTPIITAQELYWPFERLTMLRPNA
jgi:hypothetical protein